MTTAPSPHDRPLIVVADDDNNLRLLVREALELNGFQVEEAASGVQTLELFSRLRPDLIVLDVLMPEKDGFAVCAEIRKDPAGERTPVLMVTSLNDVDSISRAYEVGATDFVTKPINWLTLSHRVRYVLRASRTMEELIASQEALRESEERFRQLAENIHQVFWLADVSPLAPRLLYVSPRYEEISGSAVGSLAGQPRPFHAMMHSEDRARVTAATAGQNTGAPSDEEYRILRPDGSVRWVRERAFPVFSARHEIRRVVGIAEDITDRKTLERQRADFLAMLTHDIKNPLGIILGYAEMLSEHASARGGTEDQALLERLRSNALTVHSLVTNYLDLSRFEAGQLHLARQPVDLNDVLQRVGQQYSAEAQRRQVTLEFHPAPGGARVDGDAVALERVLTNLLHNALKFTPAGGTVALTTATDSAHVVATVRDTGPGIAPEDLPTLFAQYHQARSAKPHGGAGLGLFIVKSLVDLHGGRITVDSTPGQGAAFSVFLSVP